MGWCGARALGSPHSAEELEQRGRWAAASVCQAHSRQAVSLSLRSLQSSLLSRPCPALQALSHMAAFAEVKLLPKGVRPAAERPRLGGLLTAAQPAGAGSGRMARAQVWAAWAGRVAGAKCGGGGGKSTLGCEMNAAGGLRGQGVQIAPPSAGGT